LHLATIFPIDPSGATLRSEVLAVSYETLPILENLMYHSSLNIVVGIFVDFSSRWSGHGHGSWSHGLLGLFN
jgi:hypothetical protein